MEIKLRGSLHGVKKLQKYKNPDIIDSTISILSKTFRINTLTIKFRKDSNKYFIYHSFGDIDYSGRWYSIMLPENIVLDKNTLIIKLDNYDWEDWKTGQTSKKDITILINLTNLGVQKFLQV